MFGRTSVPRTAVMIAGIFALLGLMAVYYAVRIKPAQQAATIDKQLTGLSAPARRGQPTSFRPAKP
jgi:hypothetical protein